MKKNKTFITMALLIAVVMLGVGYAAVIANIDLTINGTASAKGNADNFKVKFVDVNNKTVSILDADANNYITASVTSDLVATFNVHDLDTAGQSATIIYNIENTSPELKANLSFDDVTNTNPEYFNVEKSFATTTLAADSSTTVTVVVTLIKTPINDDVSSTITIPIVAAPAAA